MNMPILIYPTHHDAPISNTKPYSMQLGCTDTLIYLGIDKQMHITQCGSENCYTPFHLIPELQKQMYCKDHATPKTDTGKVHSHPKDLWYN
jgi:hypothetical protein